MSGDYFEQHKGKCITCGFAAKRRYIAVHPDANPAYFEIAIDERQPDQSVDLKPTLFELRISCFRGKKDLVSLVSDRTANRTAGLPDHGYLELRKFHSKQVLEETSCDYWYQYESGRTPQEHLADFQMQTLEQQRQAFELRLFELEQKAQENSQMILADSRQLAIDNKVLAEQMKASADSSARFNRWVSRWLLVLTILTVLLAGIQVYFASKPQKPIIIQQQPAEQSPEQENNKAK